MESLNAQHIKSADLNMQIATLLMQKKDVIIENPHSMHNLAIGMSVPGRIVIQGSTGFYTGGFLEGTTVEVEGNTGWYAGDNMMAGELIIKKNTGCNAGTYFYGGTMVIYGSTGSRVGYGMKGGTIIVVGSAGRWAGQMTLGGKLIILGSVGKQIGESMYKGVIYVRDPAVQEKLGGNVYLDSLAADEIAELKNLFAKYEIVADPKEFRAIRPTTTGRHNYTLFQPVLQPELAQKYHAKA